VNARGSICFLSLSSLNAHHVVFFARKNRVKYIRKYLLVWLLSNYDESFVLMSTGTIKCAISTKTWARYINIEGLTNGKLVVKTSRIKIYVSQTTYIFLPSNADIASSSLLCFLSSKRS